MEYLEYKSPLILNSPFLTPSDALRLFPAGKHEALMKVLVDRADAHITAGEGRLPWI
jgi:hypothetical protein